MRATFFFSVERRLRARLCAPSATRMTPGRPITRCTRSCSRVKPTAGVTRQSPRMFDRIAAAAPSWPSTWLYAVACTRLPNTNAATTRPSSRPRGSEERQAAEHQAERDEHQQRPEEGDEHERQDLRVLRAGGFEGHPDLLELGPAGRLGRLPLRGRGPALGRSSLRRARGQGHEPQDRRRAGGRLRSSGPPRPCARPAPRRGPGRPAPPPRASAPCRPCWPGSTRCPSGVRGPPG